MKTKIVKTILSISLPLILASCMGDRKTVVGEDLGDTSFVNTDFKGNIIDYQDGMSACSGISVSDIAELYGVPASLVIIDDPLTNPNRQATATPICSFFIQSGKSDFEWLRGSISVEREIGKEEFMGDVAEATGAGKDWKEAWNLKKTMSRSAEWVPNLGQAALWTGKKALLEIKFEGYTLRVHPLKNISNKEEMSLNRDYKKMALGMAQAAGYIK